MNPFVAWQDYGAILPNRGWSEQALYGLLWGDNVTAIEAQWEVLLSSLGMLGPQEIFIRTRVGALGVFSDYSVAACSAATARLTAPRFQMDLQIPRVAAILATKMPYRSTSSASIRFFDQFGDSILTLEFRDAIHPALVDEWVKKHQRGTLPSMPRFAAQPMLPPDETPDNATLEAAVDAWRQLPSPHQMDPLLERFQLSREQLYKAAPASQTTPLADRDIVDILHWMIDQGHNLQLSAHRTGINTQATATPDALVVCRDGIDLVGESCRVRLDPHQLQRAWLVTRSTSDQSNQTIELLDASGELAMSIGIATPKTTAARGGMTRKGTGPMKGHGSDRSKSSAS